MMKKESSSKKTFFWPPQDLLNKEKRGKKWFSIEEGREKIWLLKKIYIPAATYIHFRLFVSVGSSNGGQDEPDEAAPAGKFFL